MKFTINKNLIIFLILSLISGILEVGSIIYGLRLHISVEYIIGLGIAYQIGNLFPIPINLNKTLLIIISFCSIVVSAIYIFTSKYIFLFLTVTFLSLAIQELRAQNKADLNTSIKRTLRILGFLLTIFISKYCFLIFSIVLVGLSMAYYKNNNKKVTFYYPNRMKYIHLIMLVHQLQYFTYCYFIILNVADIVYEKYWVLSLCFVLSWLTYSYIPNLVKGDKYIKYLIFGHAYLLVILFGMFFSNGILKIVFWIFTGFGAGTVFCITELAKKERNFVSSDMTLVENYGHILGIIIGLFLYKVTININSPILLGIIFTFLVILFSCIYLVIERKSECQ